MGRCKTEGKEITQSREGAEKAQRIKWQRYFRTKDFFKTLPSLCVLASLREIFDS
jgi:hypothetical protein